MYVYQKDSNYLVGYEIKDDKIIQYYYNDNKEYSVPNIPHNIEACDRQLLQQFHNFKKDGYLAIHNIAIARCIPDVLFLGFAFSIQQPFLFGMWSLSLGLDILNIILINQRKKHFELTDFCIEHALEIKKLSENSNNTLILSKNGQEVFEKDKSFTLNHSDQYSIGDLKQFQKAIRGK